MCSNCGPFKNHTARKKINLGMNWATFRKRRIIKKVQRTGPCVLLVYILQEINLKRSLSDRCPASQLNKVTALLEIEDKDASVVMVLIYPLKEDEA